jgi:transposase
MRLLRIAQFEKYNLIDTKEFLKDRRIELHLERDSSESMLCRRCSTTMEPGHGSYRVKVQHLPLFLNHCFLHFRRHKGYCPSCKCVRSEQ